MRPERLPGGSRHSLAAHPDAAGPRVAAHVRERLLGDPKADDPHRRRWLAVEAIGELGLGSLRLKTQELLCDRGTEPLVIEGHRARVEQQASTPGDRLAHQRDEDGVIRRAVAPRST